jgi:hypothetical protein
LSNDTFPCAETGCLYLEIATLAECERSRCPFSYARLREENAIEIQKKDAKAKEAGA